MLTLALLAVLVGGVAFVAAAWTTRRSLVDLLLAAYVIAVWEIVVVSLALSAVGQLTRAGYAVALTLVAVAVGVTAARHRPAFPEWRNTASRGRETLRDPIVAALAVIVALEVGYAATLGIVSPPNDWDALAYHLARAAFWLQQQEIAYVAGATDQRLNAFPPNAEIVDAFTLATSGGDRLVALPNLVAALVAALAVYGIARRIGLERPQAAFGALLFATLPIVALQAPSALNDLPLTALVAAAAYFFLRRSGADLALGAAATGLALGTKVTAFLALPLLLGLCWVTWRPRLGRAAIALLAAGAAGSVWYVVNLVQTGHPFGRFLSEHGGGGDLVLGLGRVMRLFLLVTDTPGGVGLDRLLYPLAGAAIAAAGLTVLRRRVDVRDALLAGALVAVVPLLVPVTDFFLRAYQKLWFEVGREDIGLIDPQRTLDVSEVITTAFGPLGLPLAAATLVLALLAVREGALPRVALLLASAPFLWVVMVGLAVEYFPYNARFALGGWVVGAACWGIVLRRRAVSAALVSIAAVTLLLSYTHYLQRPSGVALLEPTDEASAFTRSRPEALAVSEGILPVVRHLDAAVPDDATLAVWPHHFPDPEGHNLKADLLPYMAFDGRPGREVHLVESLAAAERAGAGWYVVPTVRIPAGCLPGWSRSLETTTGWTVLRRGGSAC